MSRPRPRAFHSSSPLGLHAASPSPAAPVSCYAQGLLVAERSRPCQARGHPGALATRRTPQRRRTAPPFGECGPPASTGPGSRSGRTPQERRAASRLRRAPREGARVRCGRSPEIGQASRAWPIKSLRPEADAHDRTPRNDLESSRHALTHPRTTRASNPPWPAEPSPPRRTAPAPPARARCGRHPASRGLRRRSLGAP